MPKSKAIVGNIQKAKVTRLTSKQFEECCRRIGVTPEEFTIINSPRIFCAIGKNGSEKFPNRITGISYKRHKAAAGNAWRVSCLAGGKYITESGPTLTWCLMLIMNAITVIIDQNKKAKSLINSCLNKLEEVEHQ